MGSKDEKFGPDELTSIQSGFKEVEANQIEFGPPALATNRLIELWASDLRGTLPAERDEEESGYLYSRVEESVDTHYDRAYAIIPPEPGWFLGMSDEFNKSIGGVDRKLQGRILEAIRNIINKPTEAKGDTVKPLMGDMKGFWRYRIGDYRLVYWPDAQNRRVVLVAFTSRSGAYN